MLYLQGTSTGLNVRSMVPIHDFCVADGAASTAASLSAFTLARKHAVEFMLFFSKPNVARSKVPSMRGRLSMPKKLIPQYLPARITPESRSEASNR